MDDLGFATRAFSKSLGRHFSPAELSHSRAVVYRKDLPL